MVIASHIILQRLHAFQRERGLIMDHPDKYILSFFKKCTHGNFPF